MGGIEQDDYYPRQEVYICREMYSLSLLENLMLTKNVMLITSQWNLECSLASFCKKKIFLIF